MNYAGVMAQDVPEFLVRDAAGYEARVTWYPPREPAPNGKMHGSSGVCFTSTGEVVLVCEEGRPWGLPGGRPEGGEGWRQTLDREVMEEACARVDDATLLGFTRGIYIDGPEKGLVLVRSFWRATVTLHEWQQEYEIAHRSLVAPHEALDLIAPGDGWRPIFERILFEALSIS
jgi:ADP-ribose pyrophosphatase YjhB (NUDIX family)